MTTSMRNDNLLETLFVQRWHGAVTLQRYQFQLLYSLRQAIDLLDPNPQWHTLRFEGIEDIDLSSSTGVSEYVQVKSSANQQDWGWLTREKILAKFLEVHRADPNARFRLVVDFTFVGGLLELERSFAQKPSQISPKLQRNLETAAKTCNCTLDEVIELCSALIIERTSLANLWTEIIQKIVGTLEVYTGNQELYFLALLSRTYEFTTLRKLVFAQDLVAAKLEIDQWVSEGDSNPAINYGWIERVLFEDESRVNDYFEGKGARPSHILKGLDVYRETWIRQIHNNLQNHQVCVVRASSGQGKSTLLFRYAYEFYNHHTVLIVRDIQDDSRIEPVKRFIEALLKLNLPVLVLINDLSEKTKNWHELVRRLAGKSVSFLIATRHENWFRYSSSLENIDWTTVLPELSFQEAQHIFNQFLQAGRIAPNVKSASWAYEQVSEKKLLIEFVFLITQGQMLAERLEGQIRAIYQLQEHKAKLEILRLVSLAQVLDIRLNWRVISPRIITESDLQQLLLSMRDEYLEISVDGTIEGVHYVRSDHLVSILHDSYPISNTIQALLDYVSEDDITETIYLIYVNEKLSTAYLDTVNLLVERSAQHIGRAVAITQALFRADEHRYITANQNVVNAFLSEFNAGALSVLFIHATAPVIRVDAFDLIKPLQIPTSRLERMRQLVEQMPMRGVNEVRFAKSFLDSFTSQLESEPLQNELGTVAEFNLWLTYFGIETDIIQRLVEGGLWSASLFLQPINQCAPFMLFLQEEFNTVYGRFWSTMRSSVIAHFLRSTNTLSLTIEDTEVRIKFVIDETVAPHDQTMKRLDLLRKWMPHFETYSAQGLYPITPISRLGHDETLKSIPRENFSQPSVEINSRYFQEIRSFYATHLMHDYLRFWYDCRRTSLAFVEALIERFERLMVNKFVTNIQTEIDQVWTFLQSPPELPKRYTSTFNAEHTYLREWQAEMRNFVYTYLKAQNTTNLAETRLYRLNLFSAQHGIVKVQSAINRIRRAEGIYFEFDVNDESEKAAYRRLYETVECYVEKPSNYSLGKRVKPRDYVGLRSRGRKAFFQTELRNASSTLEGYSSAISLPESWFEEPPLRNLVIGIDVCKAMDLMVAMGIAGIFLSSVTLPFDFAYIIPVLNGQAIFGFASRIAKDTVVKLNQGGATSEHIAIFPVPLSDALLNVLPSIRLTPIVESALYISAQALLGKLQGLRNEFFFITTNIADELVEYLDELKQSLYIKRDIAIAERDMLLNQLTAIDPMHAASEWEHFWKYYHSQTQWHYEQIFELQGYTARPPEDDVNLSELYQRYILSRYCS